MASCSGIITLLTDFGLDDPFVGVMKGVIFGRHPSANVVDLCHGLRAGSVEQAAFWIERSYRYFPAGTVHVAVVDPGVGSARKAVAIRAAEHYFIGPDNGLFAGVIAGAPGAEVRLIDGDRLGLPAPSRTFHGRDLFAPAAAELAAGRAGFEALGEPTTLDVTSGRAEPVVGEAGIDGVIVTVDRFGNLLSNVGEALLGERDWDVIVAGGRCALLGTYADVPSGALVAVINAFGVVEVAMRDGSARARLGVDAGAALRLEAQSPPAGAGPRRRP
jgi:S-adenosylmethionine hydrolase